MAVQASLCRTLSETEIVHIVIAGDQLMTSWVREFKCVGHVFIYVTSMEGRGNMLLLHSIYSNHIYECEATKWEKRLYGGKKLRLSGKTMPRNGVQIYLEIGL